MTQLEQKFVHAIAFCLRCDGHSGDLEAWAKWALRLSDEAPEDPQKEVALVSGGATKIKGYVFESARLPEIRGASGLLDRINLVDVPCLWEKLGCRDCLIYANGGEVLAFAPVSKAAWLADEIERIYTYETLVAQSVAVWQKFTLKQLRDGLLADEPLTDAQAETVKQLLGYNPAENKTFGSLVAPLALAKFRRREANPDDDDRRTPQLRALAHFETVPFERRCSSCERRGAVVNARVGDDDRPLCEPCARKRVYGQRAKEDDPSDWKWYREAQFTWEPKPQKSWVLQFAEWVNQQPLAVHQGYPIQNIHAADDLGEIGQAATPEGFIGVVYADGNNMGGLLEELRTPVEYSQFADAVYEATKDAVFEALMRRLSPIEATDERGRRRRIYPFEILSIGGDDFFLIVPAHVALPIACDIAKAVEEKLRNHPLFKLKDGYVWEQAQRCKKDGEPPPQCKVSLSAGVVLADAHTPVFYLEELAGQLLKSAKRRAKWLKRERNYYGGTVDFLALKSVTMISGTVEEFRQAALTPRHGRLYARPYTIAEMEALLESIKSLKTANFPRNQLYRLRESLRRSREQSTIDYLYFLSRDKDVQKARGDIEKKWTPSNEALPHPWRKQLEDDKQWETIWHDLVELWDFVSKEEGNHVQHHD
jgi:CRISPR-associated protein Cmr2